MKFQKDTKDFDESMLLVEMNRLGSKFEDIPIDEIQGFIKKRRGRVKKIKDFRKSQNTKAAWRKNRSSKRRAIQKWHKSTAGKRFHRKLGRFLATRVTEKYDVSEDLQYETLKAVSSVRTHLYIEGEYYRPSIEDEIEFSELIEHVVPILNSVESKLIVEDYNINEEELEILLELCLQSDLIDSLAEMSDLESSDLMRKFNSLDVSEDVHYYLLTKCYQALSLDNKVDEMVTLNDGI